MKQKKCLSGYVLMKMVNQVLNKN